MLCVTRAICAICIIQCCFPVSSSVPYVSCNHELIYSIEPAPCHMKFSNFYNRSSEKRVSAVALGNDGLYACFADKFGVVWVVDLDGFDGNEALVSKKAAPMLSHYCSIITSLVSAIIDFLFCDFL
jgi:hypothetical protein